MANDSSAPVPSHDFDLISSLGKYKIQRKVGSGGMGAVYLAVDQQLKRTVALKVLPKDKASNQVLVRRFKAEGQAGAQLEHPNIVSVYESGEIDGYLYLAMEFVEGIDAFDLLRKRGIVPVKRSLDIIKQVTLALQHAHERQVVHRDIKPSNLMIRERDGVVKLADMGLARIIEDDGESAITKAGTTVGTVDYMSPEQGRDSKAADIRSDIYSLGCTWYHLIAGKAPYPEGDLMNKLRAHALQPVPDPRLWNESIPPGVVAVLQRMMAKKPDDRYQTPQELLADLGSPAILRGDLSADQLKLLANAHTPAPDDENEADEDGETDGGEASATSPRLRPAKTKSGRDRSSNRAARELPADDDEPQDAESYPSPARSKAKTKKSGGREILSARTALTSASSEDLEQGRSAKSGKAERVLPGRVTKQQLVDVPTSTIDPNHLKLGLLILVIGVGVGGILYAIKYFNGSANGGATAENPYANGESSNPPPLPPPAVATIPSANTEGSTTPPGTEVVSPSVVDAPGTVTESTSNMAASKVSVDSTPFAGEIPYSPDGAGPLPAWVWQTRTTATANPPKIIRRVNPANGEHRTLQTAIASAKGDVVFEFGDVGPHEIPAIELKHPHRWTFRAAEGVEPVLVLRSSNQSLNVQTGTLSFIGVHLVAMPEQSSPVIQVGSGSLVLRKSSVTHLGPNATAVISADAGAKIITEYALIRGQGPCHAIQLKGENTSCVAGQSLFVVGGGSAIQIESEEKTGDRRLVTLIASACLSGQSAIHCSHRGRRPPSCDFQIMRSILGYLPGHSAEAVGVHFSGWSNTSDGLDRPRVSSVSWTSDQSFFVGWPHWAELEFEDRSEPVDVRDEDAWRAFWRQATPSGALIPDGADLHAVSDANARASSVLVQAGFAGIRTQLGESGPKWSDIPTPPHSVISNILSFGQSPRIATSLDAPDPGTTLRFDLKKQTLGKFLSSDECPDGSTVIAFGSGLRTIDPFVIRQKRIQLVFEQSEGTPLVLQPAYKTEPGATRPAAWFGVEDGQLSLTNGTFRLVSSNTRNYPERFLQMTGGLAAVRQCRVEVAESSWPLIDLLPSEGHAPPQLLVDQSLVVGQKSLIRVGAAESLIDVRRSILASLAGVALTLDTGGAGTQCFLNGSTISSGKSAYQIQPMGERRAVGLFARETVFQGGSVMTLETDASLVQWWGIENGYSNAMKTFLVTRGTSGMQDFTRDWVQGWGAGHELLPIYGANDTLLPDVPGNVVDVSPESFQLHPDCVASHAGEHGNGIGAPVAKIGPSRIAASPPGPTPSKNAPKGGTPPKPTVPDF